jgi:hypothetical protein
MSEQKPIVVGGQKLEGITICFQIPQRRTEEKAK